MAHGERALAEATTAAQNCEDNFPMSTFGYIGLIVALLAFSVWTHIEAYTRGYNRGRKDAIGHEDSES
jgi:hypothetical protein